MNILYEIVKPVVRIALKSYFKNIQIVGGENIPSKGPAIIVSNHPSAIHDPLLVVMLFKQDINFIAAAEYFGKGIQNWWLTNAFNMIPVVRPLMLKEGEVANNDEMFQHCYNRLDEDKIILVFPEGTSKTEFRLRTLKTGVARIVRGAETHFKSDKKVKVIPVGLNYEDPHKFQSDVIITVGEAVNFDGCNFDDEQLQIKEMTEVIEKEMQKNLWHIPDPELDNLIAKLRSVLSYTLPEDHDFSMEDPEKIFQMHQDIIDGVQYFQAGDSGKNDKVHELLDHYLRTLKELDITERELFQIRITERKRKWAMFTLFTPFALVSILLNFIPFWLTKFTFDKKIAPNIASDYDFRKPMTPAFSGSMVFAVGTLVFLAWYSVIGILLSLLLGSWWLFFPIVGLMHFLSFLGLKWIRMFSRVWEGRKFIKLNKYKNKELTDCLIARKTLLNFINDLKNEFLSSRRNQKSAVEN